VQTFEKIVSFGFARRPGLDDSQRGDVSHSIVAINHQMMGSCHPRLSSHKTAGDGQNATETPSTNSNIDLGS
jgi:hypothetical protein